MAGDGRQPSAFLQVTRRNLIKAGALGATAATAQALPLNAPPSLTCYVAIEGAAQGKIIGDRADGKITGLAFFHAVLSPRDPASGQATGKRQHGPIRVVKEWGAATPQLFRALVSNETLRKVTFEFLRPGKGGTEEVYFTVQLTNAALTGIEQHAETGTELEEISFVYQKIAWTHLPSGSTAEDNWQANNV